MKDKAKAAMAIDLVYAFASLLRDTGIQITILPAPRCICAAEADPEPDASDGLEAADPKPANEPGIDVGYPFGRSTAGADLAGECAISKTADAGRPVAKFVNGDMVTLKTSVPDVIERAQPVPAGILRTTAPIEEGQVIGVSTWLNNPMPTYLVRYRAGDGRQVEEWLTEDAIVLSSEVHG